MIRLQKTRAPHVRTSEDSTMIMRDVAFALCAPTVMAIYYYGFRVFFIVLTSVLTCFLADTFCLIIQKKKRSGNISPLITGMIIALLMPASVSYSVVIVAGLFAILVVKHPFGGLGNNIFNPACAGVAFAMVCWNSNVTMYPDPSALNNLPLFGEITAKLSPGPAAMLKELAMPISNNFDLLFGNFAGPMGTTNFLIIALAAVYLLYRRVISWHIPVSFMGAAALLAAIYPRLTAIGVSVEKSIVVELCVGALFFSSVFVATDPVTSPTFSSSKLIYGAGCGVLTMLFRFLGNFPEGVMFAILIMNALSGFVDKFILDQKSGNSWLRQLKQARLRYKENPEYQLIQSQVEENKKKQQEIKKQKKAEAEERRAKQAEKKAAEAAKKAEEKAAEMAAKAEEAAKKAVEDEKINQEIQVDQNVTEKEVLGINEMSETTEGNMLLIEKSEEAFEEILEEIVDSETSEKEIAISEEKETLLMKENLEENAEESEIDSIEKNLIEEEIVSEVKEETIIKNGFQFNKEVLEEEVIITENMEKAPVETVRANEPLEKEIIQPQHEETIETVKEEILEIEEKIEKEEIVKEILPEIKEEKVVKKGFSFNPLPVIEEVDLEKKIEFKEEPVQRKRTSRGGWGRGSGSPKNSVKKKNENSSDNDKEEEN